MIAISTLGWIIFLILILPAIGLLVWLMLAASLIRAPSGSLGLVMAGGKATDRTLLPGPHFVFAFRRVIVEEYPSVELAYRADGRRDDENVGFVRHRGAAGTAAASRPVGNVGTPVAGDPGRSDRGDGGLHGAVPTDPGEPFAWSMSGTARMVFGIVRDTSAHAVLGNARRPSRGIEQFFGTRRQSCQDRLATAVSAALEEEGIKMTGFVLAAVDLGRTGEVIQATVRARYELERERAEAQTRTLRARNDADLQKQLSARCDDAWRYRETDLWREMVTRTETLNVALRAAPGPAPFAARVADDTPPDRTDQGSSA